MNQSKLFETKYVIDTETQDLIKAIAVKLGIAVEPAVEVAVEVEPKTMLEVGIARTRGPNNPALKTNPEAQGLLARAKIARSAIKDLEEQIATTTAASVRERLTTRLDQHRVELHVATTSYFRLAKRLSRSTETSN